MVIPKGLILEDRQMAAFHPKIFGCIGFSEILILLWQKSTFGARDDEQQSRMTVATIHIP
jgi:hypothetical protein